MDPDEQTQSGQRRPELRPPGFDRQAGTDPKGNNRLLWTALSVVFTLVLVVLLVLPKLVSTRGDGSPVTDAAPVATEPALPSAPSSTSARSEAEQALQTFLQTRARLELANVGAWGEPQWSQALETAENGNRLFGQRQFSLAAEALTESMERLRLLEAEREPRLAGALDAGWRALLADDSASAAAFFATALAIDEDSEDALNGAGRARVRPDLLRLMDSGEQARASGDLEDAQAAFLTAVELDGAYEPALAALQDTRVQINDLAFKDAMSRALIALEAEQVATAEAALQQAASLRPADVVVQDARLQLAQTRQRLWLAKQRQSAASDKQNENWSAAVTTYRAVLARVPDAAFAHQGLVFAQDRERLHQQLDHYLSDPERIYADQPLANAEQLIKSAGTAPAAETRLAEKIHELQLLIKQATTAYPITLSSDGMTSAQVYRVGRLGQFTSRQLELRPGTYTVVGTRPGYRDVRQTLTVRPGSIQPVLDIRCEETL